MRITLHALTSLKATFPIRKSEWLMAFATCAFWLLFSVRYDLFTSSDAYNGLAALAPQWVWSWFCFFVGIGRLAVLFVNGAYWRTPHARAAFAFLNYFLWYNLTVGLSVNLSLGMISFTTFFFADVFNFRQAFSEAAASEGIHNAGRHRTNSARHTR